MGSSAGCGKSRGRSLPDVQFTLSIEHARGIPDPRMELALEKGRIRYQANNPAAWVAHWRQRFEDSRQR